MYISKVLQLFLVKYQTNEAVIMFLAKDLHDICWKLMHKFVKKSVFDSADKVYKIAKLHVLDKKNHKAAAEIDVGFAAKVTLVNLVKNKAVGERGSPEFRME